MKRKIAISIMAFVAIILLFNLAISLFPNWESTVRIQLAILDYYVTLGYGTLVF